jgi:uncharacterized protein (TIGR00159 family)
MEIFSLRTLSIVVDVLIVAAILYWIMRLIKGSRAAKMIWGLGLIALVYFVSQSAGLMTLNWLLSNFLGSIAILVIVVFQQDIRKALTHMGSTLSAAQMPATTETFEEICAAVAEMSAARTGAIMAIEREVDLTGIADAGVEVDASVSKELLLSIFSRGSALHDGAVVIRGTRAARAGAILPLADVDLDKGLGTRHRAALGLSAETDAVVIVVSERSGKVSVSVDGEMEKGLDHDALLARLKSLFISAAEPGGGAASYRGPGS